MRAGEFVLVVTLTAGGFSAMKLPVVNRKATMRFGWHGPQGGSWVCSESNTAACRVTTTATTVIYGEGFTSDSLSRIARSPYDEHKPV